MHHRITSAMGHLLHCAICIAVAAGAYADSAVLKAQDDVRPQSNVEDKTEGILRAASVRTMQAAATLLRVSRQGTDGGVECKMDSDSVLNWSDPVRHPELINPDTTWIWHDNGRPHLIAEIYGRVESPGKWHIYVCSVSSDSVTLADKSREWVAPKSYYDPKDISGAPEVAKTRPARSLQMNRLAARFDAHRFWRGRYQLRLLARSIYRYDPAPGPILDGAVYTLVHGTNPEILILIEAHEVSDAPAQWKVSFGSLAAAKCTVRIDEQEFWSCEKDQGAPSDPRRFLTRNVPILQLPAVEN